jgi:hypothetical protein
MATAAPRTIARNATRQIAVLQATHTECKVYTLGNYFTGRDCPAERAWEAARKFPRGKIRLNADGSVTIRLHSSHWYELRAAGTQS